MNGEWIRTADQLPEEDTLVLTYHLQYSAVSSKYQFQIMRGYQVRLLGSCVSHWMPLPDKPEGM